MKRFLVALSLMVATTGFADLVPGGSGSPATFPSGFSGDTSGAAAGLGEVGEVLEDIRTTPIAAVANTYIDVASLDLTAGHWIINYVCEMGAGWADGMFISISTTSASETGAIVPKTRTFHSMPSDQGTQSSVRSTGTYSLSISAGDTYYMNCQQKGATGAGSPSFTGYMMALRIR